MIFIRTFILALVVPVMIARGQDWSLTTADFHTQPAVLRALSSDGLHVILPDSAAEHVIPFDQFVSAQRPLSDQPAAPKFTLLLAGGDRLVGQPGEVSGEKLIWISPSLGKVPASINRMVAIGRGDEVALPDEPPRQDVVTLVNGDSVAGVFTNFADNNVTIQTDAGPTPVPLPSIARIVFAATPSAVVSSDRAFRLRLNDGSIITAADATIDGDHLTLTLPGKNQSPIQLPLSDLHSIEQLNGPVSWLSCRAPTENVQTPYIGGAPQWPARFDSAVDGSPLQFDGRRFDHGIGVHAYSRLTFAVDPQWTTFRTQYAIDSRRENPSTLADVTVRIKVDGKLVHEQTHVRQGVLSPVITVDLKDAKLLTLECDYGDAGDTQARLNWLQPALLRETKMENRR
jgi:hypothetical protein